MSIRPSGAKGAYTGSVGGGGGGSVTDVTATLPVTSTGGATPNIALSGIVGFGAAGQALRVNAGGTAMEWFTPAAGGGVNDVTATAPLASSGGAMPNISVMGLAGLGTALQVMGVNAAGTAMEWVTSTGTGLNVRATNPTLPGATIANFTFVGNDIRRTVAGQAIIQSGTGSSYSTRGPLLLMDAVAATPYWAVVPGPTGVFYVESNITSTPAGPRVTGFRMGQGNNVEIGDPDGNYAVGLTRINNPFMVRSNFGAFATTPVAQQTLTTTTVPNPSTDTIAFIAFLQSMTDGLRAYGWFA